MRDFVFSSFLAIAIFALTPAALAAHGNDAPFGAFLTEGDLSTTRERFDDTDSHFQGRLVDEAADEDSPDSLDRVPDEGEKLAGFVDDFAADQEFLDAIKRPGEGEDPPPRTAYGKAIKWVETHFKFTERVIRDIADVLERAAGGAKRAEGFNLRNHLVNNLRKGLPVPRSIWGVTVFDLSSSRNTVGLRAASDKRLDDQWDDEPDEFDGQLMEFDAVLKTYANPETLFRRANGALASMVDVNRDPGTGAFHASTHFLRELSIVRQLAQVAFPNIEIADVPSLESSGRSLDHPVRGRHQGMVQGRALYSIGLPDDLSSSRSLAMGRAYEPQGSASTAIGISESVVSWVRSLADNVHTGFDQILQTEKLSSKKDQRLPSNKEKLIERVKNANMMVQALILYTSGVRLQNAALNVNSTALWQLVLRGPFLGVYADALDRSYDITTDSLDRIRKFWGDFAAGEDKDAPFGTFLTEGASSRTRERFADTESLFQERLVDQAADKEFLNSADKAPNEGEKSAGFKDDSAADEEFFDAIDSFPNEGEKFAGFKDDSAADEEFFDAIDSFPDLAVSRIMTEGELAEDKELHIHFNNRKLTRLLEHEFKTKPRSDSQIREAVNQNDGKQLYFIVICPICHDSMHDVTLATPRCGHAIHAKCLVDAHNVCPLCRDEGPHENTQVETLLKKLLELFEDEGVIPESYISSVKTYFELTERIIRGIADALKSAAYIVKNKEKRELSDGLAKIHSRGLPVPRAIWGVTVFDYNLELREDEDPDGESDGESDGEFDDESDNESDDEPDDNEYEFDGQLMEHIGQWLELHEQSEFHAVLKTYDNPGTLFRDANGDFASMVDDKFHPRSGALHARAHFLRQLSIVRQLAQVAFPNIEIADVPAPKSSRRSLRYPVRGMRQGMAQGRASYGIGLPEDLSSFRSLAMGRANEPQGSATTAIDISESVISWVLSLADNVRTGLDQILQTEESLSINKERLIERVENANMMVQALILYTCRVHTQTSATYESLTELLQLILRRPTNKFYARVFNRIALRRPADVVGIKLALVKAHDRQ